MKIIFKDVSQNNTVVLFGMSHSNIGSISSFTSSFNSAVVATSGSGGFSGGGGG